MECCYVVLWCVHASRIKLLKKTQIALLEETFAKHARPCRNCANAVNWQIPCLGPAAVEAVNSVEVEVNSSEIPVSGGEFR